MTLLAQLATQLITQAEAAPGAQGPAGPLAGLTGLLPFVLMFGVIYFLLVRPANKQRKDHAELLNTLKKDDEVVTTGGIYGRIIGLEDKVATLEIADKVKIRILRDRIAGKWNPDSVSATTAQR
jgi:preprotein translocase subunit YajC